MKSKNSVIAALIFLLILGGCGLFDTREPENPVGTPHFWTPPLSPGDVLDNITEAFSRRDDWLYMKSFAEPDFTDSAFIFFPDISSVSYDSTIFANWDYYAEQTFIRNFFDLQILPQDSTVFIEFTPESEPPGEDLPIYREYYSIVYGHANPNLPREYSGRADIQFDRNRSGNWVIISWKDEKMGDYPSMTELKASISTN